jgi:hypothetical protein
MVFNLLPLESVKHDFCFVSSAVRFCASLQLWRIKKVAMKNTRCCVHHTYSIPHRSCGVRQTSVQCLSVLQSVSGALLSCLAPMALNIFVFTHSGTLTSKTRYTRNRKHTQGDCCEELFTSLHVKCRRRVPVPQNNLPRNRTHHAYS